MSCLLLLAVFGSTALTSASATRRTLSRDNFGRHDNHSLKRQLQAEPLFWIEIFNDSGMAIQVHGTEAATSNGKRIHTRSGDLTRREGMLLDHGHFWEFSVLPTQYEFVVEALPEQKHPKQKNQNHHLATSPRTLNNKNTNKRKQSRRYRNPLVLDLSDAVADGEEPLYVTVTKDWEIRYDRNINDGDSDDWNDESEASSSYDDDEEENSEEDFNHKYDSEDASTSMDDSDSDDTESRDQEEEEEDIKTADQWYHFIWDTCHQKAVQEGTAEKDGTTEAIGDRVTSTTTTGNKQFMACIQQYLLLSNNTTTIKTTSTSDRDNMTNRIMPWITRRRLAKSWEDYACEDHDLPTSPSLRTELWHHQLVTNDASDDGSQEQKAPITTSYQVQILHDSSVLSSGSGSAGRGGIGSSQIHLLEHFVTSGECASILEASNPNLERARIVDPKEPQKLVNTQIFSEHRRAWQGRVDSDEDDAVLQGLRNRVYDYTNHVVGFDEPILPTDEGQESMANIQYFGRNLSSGDDNDNANDFAPDRYLPHCDGPCDGKIHTPGTRIATVVMYWYVLCILLQCITERQMLVRICSYEAGGLIRYVDPHHCRSNFVEHSEVPSIGGHTNFRHAGVHIRPQPGSAVFFSYIDPHTLVKDDGFTSHSGCPVYQGNKKILTQWIRLGVDEDDDSTGGEVDSSDDDDGDEDEGGTIDSSVGVGSIE